MQLRNADLGRYRMKTVLSFLGLILAILIAGSLFSGLLVLLAFGLGWLLRLIIPFSPFESTLLSLIALIAVGVLVVSILRSPLTLSSPLEEDDEEDEDEGEDDEEDELYMDIDPGQPLVGYLTTNRWRKAARRDDIPVVDPDERCPCGSGRKYKNCHGRNLTRKEKS
jgi:F0F1-type ATP synthase assembly protein I